MKGVATIGKKGGSGKTTLAHLLALGSCWKGVPTHFMHTDDRHPIKVDGRPYMYYDARKPEALEALIASACNADGLCVLDSGGNRPEFDFWIATSMDLVLMPVTPDPEDVTVSLAHMEALDRHAKGNAYFILNRVPSNIHEKTYVARYLNRLPKERVLCWLPEMKAVRMLREDDDAPFQTPPSKVNGMARNFYVEIAHRLAEMAAEGDRRAA